MTRPIMTSDEGKEVLDRIRKIKPFIQASFTITKKRCGNPTCVCTKKGPIHEAALLTWKKGKKTHTIYVPIEFRREVAQWVEEGKRLRQLITEMSEAQKEFLLSKKVNMTSKKA